MSLYFSAVGLCMMFFLFNPKLKVHLVGCLCNCCKVNECHTILTGTADGIVGVWYRKIVWAASSAFVAERSFVSDGMAKYAKAPAVPERPDTTAAWRDARSRWETSEPLPSCIPQNPSPTMSIARGPNQWTEQSSAINEAIIDEVTTAPGRNTVHFK